MNTLIISKYQNFVPTAQVLLGCLAIAIGCSLALPYLFSSNRTIGFVDAGIWQLLLIAFIAWVLSLWLSATAFNWLLDRMDIPAISIIIQPFNKLSPWQKLKSYFLLFACLLGSVIGTLTAVI